MCEPKSLTEDRTATVDLTDVNGNRVELTAFVHLFGDEAPHQPEHAAD